MRPSVSAGLLILALVFAAIVSAMAALAISLHPLAEVHGGLLEPIRFCGRLLGEPALRAVLATSLVVTVVAVHILIGVAAWTRARHRLSELELLLSLLPAPKSSMRLQRLARRVGLADPVKMVDSPEPFVFTAGLVNPSIYLSTGAARILHDDELEAVLRHEKHHQEARDPLKVQLITALCACLGYLPAIGRLSEMFLRDREYDSDDAALSAMQSVRPLLSAFVKLGALNVSRAAPLAAYSDFASDRVSRLLGTASATRSGDVKSLLGAGLASVFIVASMPLLALLLTEPHLPSILGFR